MAEKNSMKIFFCCLKWQICDFGMGKLHDAAKRGDVAAVKAALSAGAAVNERDEKVCDVPN